MKTIGFVDYYISEWHANEYPAWIKEANEKLGEDFELKYAWAELDKSLVDGVSTDEWCAKYGVEKCATIQELCEKADYIIVLSPSNPEKHLEYVKTVFKYKKNTYVDKTFAPDAATAKAIFDEAEKYGTKFFSSSALRYATELDPLVGATTALTIGGGGSLDEYIIHQAEMLVKLACARPTSVTATLKGKGQYVLDVELEGGKCGTMIYGNGCDFAVCAENKDGDSRYTGIASPFFNNLLADILRFFEEGTTSFDVNETLYVMQIREAAVKASREIGKKIVI
jgi:hypothetical protein